MFRAHFRKNVHDNNKLFSNQTEIVVSGAELMYKKVEKNTICQLKNWLKCRNSPLKEKSNNLLTGMYSMKIIFTLVILRNE